MNPFQRTLTLAATVLVSEATLASDSPSSLNARYLDGEPKAREQLVRAVANQTQSSLSRDEKFETTTKPRGLLFRRRHSAEFLSALKQLILNPADPDWLSKPTDDGIRRIASKYELYKKRETNAHLRYFEGDISFWRDHIEKTITSGTRSRTYKIDYLWEVELILLAHSIVLEDAEAAHIRIPSKGDWTHAAITVLGEIWDIGQDVVRTAQQPQNKDGTGP